MSGPDGAWAVIAGGGTAGHVEPGLAIARELVARGLDRDGIHYVGSERGIEQRLVPAAGFPLTVLPGRGIQRRLTLANVSAILGLLRAMLQAVILVRRLRPAVVIGLGGYASVPCVFGAVLWRVPIVVAEQNAVPGVANRLAARFAKACAVSFRETDLARSTWTGNPVRTQVLAVDRARDRPKARQRLGVEEPRRLVAVFGGSLGARRINEATIDAAGTWRGRADLALRHIAGSRDYADLASRPPTSGGDALQYDLIEYEDDMPTVYAAADLVVCRSGATSSAEIAVVGVPALMVPLPGAPSDHQTANARALENAGGAVLVADADLDGARLVHEVDQLMADPVRLDEMGDAVRSIARPDAAAAVVDLVERHARRPLSPRSTT